MNQETFDLYDLKVEVLTGDKPFVCSHRPGDAFEVHGENLVFTKDSTFSMYALSALLPLLPAKQRLLQTADWMSTDHVIACPDPHCGARFRISRIGRKTIRRDATTVVPSDSPDAWT